jgi:hypothetical protein
MLYAYRVAFSSWKPGDRAVGTISRQFMKLGSAMRYVREVHRNGSFQECWIFGIGTREGCQRHILPAENGRLVVLPRNPEVPLPDGAINDIKVRL